MLVGLHVATNFQMYRQNSEKTLFGGGGDTLMASNAKEADIWFGRESAREARGKFKDLVCLVVFLCWIKRFVLLSLCLKWKSMNRYFLSFQKSRGGRSPPEKFEGGTRPPVPPPPPRDRRLWLGGGGGIAVKFGTHKFPALFLNWYLRILLMTIIFANYIQKHISFYW